MKRYIPVAAGLLMTSLPAMAGINGDVGLYYDAKSNNDLLGALSGDGHGYGLTTNWNFGGPTAHFEYRKVKNDIDQAPGNKTDEKGWRLGGGYEWALNSQFNLGANLEYVKMKDDYAGGALIIDSKGWGLHAEGDYTPIQQLTLGLSLGYLKLSGDSASAGPGVDLGSKGLEYDIGATYNIIEQFAVSLNYRVYDGTLEDCSSCGGDGETFKNKGLMLGAAYRFKIK